MTNKIVRFEIGTEDAPRSGAFYAALFDWQLTPAGPGFAIATGADPAGGIVALGHEPRRYTMFYVEVADLAASLARVAELGGALQVGPVPLPTGRFAWITDPDGNTVGLWQPTPA